MKSAKKWDNLLRETENKTSLNGTNGKLLAKSWIRGRSRCGAAVTRFNGKTTTAAWEDIFR